MNEPRESYSSRKAENTLREGIVMSESEVKKCPKCDGEMEQGEFSPAHILSHRFLKKGDLRGDEIIPFYCKNCGYIEIYKEMKEKRR